MKSSDEDKLLKKLYQKGHQDMPPSHLDDFIIGYAKSGQSNKNNWRPWLAAASVILVMPIIWLLIQNNELIEYSSDITTEELSTPGNINDIQPETSLDEKSPQIPEQTEAKTIYSENDNPESTMPSSSPYNSAGNSNAYNSIEPKQESMKLKVTGSRIKHESVELNKQLLMEEFKAGKKTIKPSQLSRTMAMEIAQFHQYIEDDQLLLAEQLLNELQQREPDYDYQELLNILTNAKANQ